MDLVSIANQSLASNTLSVMVKYSLAWAQLHILDTVCCGVGLGQEAYHCLISKIQQAVEVLEVQAVKSGPTIA